MAKAVYDRIPQNRSTQLRDIYLRHGVNLTRYSNFQAKKLLDILDTANVQIKSVVIKAKAVETKSKYLQIEREIKRITDELTEQLNETVKADFKDLAEEELLFVQSAMRRVGVTADFELPAPARVWSAASFGTYGGEGGKDTYQSYLDGFGQNTFKVWDNAVRSGYLFGQTAQQINRTVLGSMQNLEVGQMQSLRKSLETNTITMISHLTSEARSETYRRNSSLFSGYRYIATLCSRTCVLCGSMDQKVYPTEEEAPDTPIHPRCRCVILPEVKGMEGFDDDDERAGMTYSEDKDGNISGTGKPHPANMSYEEWLKTQDEATQKDILGATRYYMFKSGDSISSFVVDGQKLTLEQLAEKEGFSFASYNTDDKTIASQVYRGTVDYSKLSNAEAIHKEAQWINENGEFYHREYGSILSKDNKLLGTWAGTESVINIDEEEFKKATWGIGRVDFLHNHSSGTSFSYADMITMCRNHKLDRVMISLPDNTVDYLTVNNGDRPPSKSIKFAYMAHHSRYQREEKLQSGVDKLLPKQEIDVSIKVTDMLKELFGWEHGKI